ncbi:hypothetical protein TNCV_2962541 [Trichonephila clavipes]|nr:hypothetical protein TNCV_2962541 [Trichonephila clavipes]
MYQRSSVGNVDDLSTRHSVGLVSSDRGRTSGTCAINGMRHNILGTPVIRPRLFSVGYVKSLVYEDKPQTLDHLEDNIRRVIADIRPQMLEKVIENWTSRLDYIRASRGSPMPEIIFKM